MGYPLFSPRLTRPSPARPQAAAAFAGHWRPPARRRRTASSSRPRVRPRVSVLATPERVGPRRQPVGPGSD
eukprot:scaffold47252_cov59-Phaeocystis_antarctica.AAC.5